MDIRKLRLWFYHCNSFQNLKVIEKIWCDKAKHQSSSKWNRKENKLDGGYKHEYYKFSAILRQKGKSERNKEKTQNTVITVISNVCENINK